MIALRHLRSLKWSLAGALAAALASLRTPPRRAILHLLVLWLGAVAAWSLLIALNLPPLRH